MPQILIGIFLVFISTLTFANVAPAKYIEAEPTVVAELTPQQELSNLKEGNQRLLTGKLRYPDLLKQAKITAPSQYPYAVILSCMDSRGSPELLFDQGIGEIFSIRVAGNVLNNDNLGSLEFATAVTGSKLIVVMGHTNCGAMRGTCENVKLGHLTDFINKIKPAFSLTKKSYSKINCADQTLIDAIAKNNVLLVKKQISKQSPIIAKLIKENKVQIVGAIHNIATGEVTFF